MFLTVDGGEVGGEAFDFGWLDEEVVLDLEVLFVDRSGVTDDGIVVGCG